MEQAVVEEALIATGPSEAETPPRSEKGAERTDTDAAQEPSFVAGLSDDLDAGAPDLTHDSLLGIIGQYGRYVALFVGAGLISGSVVHFPLAPTRYAVIGGVGALIFALASVLAEWDRMDPVALVRVAASSLALALGIGMISGSIQHFQDIPDRAARLIPLGLALSAAAFLVRNRLRPRKGDLAVITAWVAIAAAFLALTLGHVAQGIGSEAEGHSHGATTEAASSETAASPKPASTRDDTSARSGTESAKATPKQDGTRDRTPARPKAKPARAAVKPADDGHDHEH